jgi:hypothetical protein
MKESLLELMQTSADNGQPVWNWDAQELAWEIQAYVDEFAEADENQMIEVIKEIQMEYKNA